MNVCGKRFRAAAAVVGAALAATLGLGASPASAATSDGWVRGYDTYVGDWGDEGTVSMLVSQYKNSNATCLWQRVLWAEGAGGDPEHPFYEGWINGSFGPETSSATFNLQRRWGLTADSYVGPKTFGRADDNLVKTGGSTGRGETLYLEYRGRSHTFPVRRNTEGKYLFKDADGTWRQAGYNYRTCS
ncbi:Tat pathway signal protein [Streptomyces sp. R302]|uniref:peptidoglycan-binding domain-containing protein n=1 Tax=unclassified Streptomyces TaxID=2593676 RepID=UPI00145DF992|nr:MULTISPECIES: Tat pathway signal protein [unclassified Streptomyces]NML49235.1 Tat pathway signal protein [Streptomyces sp. R301]NML77562.1 Tat pathway signal protein [Streptomyces sp. R302]